MQMQVAKMLNTFAAVPRPAAADVGALGEAPPAGGALGEHGQGSSEERHQHPWGSRELRGVCVQVRGPAVSTVYTECNQLLPPGGGSIAASSL